MEVGPHVIRMLVRRATHALWPSRALSLEHRWCDEPDFPEPLIPYDRIYARRWRSDATAPQVWAMRAAHALLLARLRVERWLDSTKADRSPRVVVTACWAFPIYSQTFVHQEVASLAQAGFSVRFLYTRLASRADLADTVRACGRSDAVSCCTPRSVRAIWRRFAAGCPRRCSSWSS